MLDDTEDGLLSCPGTSYECKTLQPNNSNEIHSSCSSTVNQAGATVNVQISRKNNLFRTVAQKRTAPLIRPYFVMRNFSFISLILSFLAVRLSAEDFESPFFTEPNEAPYYVKELESGPLLKCSIGESYRNRGRYELEWIKVVGGLPITVSRNSEIFDKKYYNLEENIKSGEYNLRVKIVALAQDNGNFFCALIDLENRHRQFHSRPANIVVVVRPEEPQIVEEPSDTVRENSLVKLECSSKGGNPPPRFAWIFDNNTEVPSSWVQHSHSTKDISTSILRWQVKSEDNGAFLTCQIWNEAMHAAEILSAETRKINVLYAPKVTVGPQSELNVEEGESVELTCQADGNPKPGHFEWKHVASGVSFAQPKWRFNADRHLHGEFQCIASNNIDAGTARMHVNVLYAPRLRIRQLSGDAIAATDVTGSRVEPSEAEELVLECEVDAVPAVDQISWLSPAGNFLHNGSRLVIPNIQQTDIGNFTCLASNTLIGLHSPSLTSSQSVGSTLTQVRTSEASVFVDIRRKPGPATVSVTSNPVIVGDRVALTCKAADVGNPPASYRWEAPHGFTDKVSLDSQELIVESAKLENNGRYKCIAYNSIGQGKEAIAKILVIEPARILHSLPAKKTFDAGDTDSSIYCEAQGYPAPHFQWHKDGVVIADSNTLSSSVQHWIAKEQEHNRNGCIGNTDEPCLRTVVGTLAFFDTVQWSDKGNYTCRAYNDGIGANAAAEWAQSTVTVTVTHEPVVLNERSQENGVALAAADLGSPAQIICLVSSHPTPSITWKRDNRRITKEDEPRYTVHSSRLYGRQDEYESILHLDNVIPEDYGSYGCVATNGAGSKKAELEIRLQAKSRPHAPRNPRLLKRGATWLQVGWQASFDGGEEQTFEVEFHSVDPYSTDGDSVLMESYVKDAVTNFVYCTHNLSTTAVYGMNYPTANGDPSTEIIRRRRSPISDVSSSTQTFAVHNMTRLRPAEAFRWRVRARNSLGTSDWTLITMVETADIIENEAIIAPESAQYFFDEQKLIIQPFKSTVTSILANNKPHVKAKNNKEAWKKASAGLCTLIYAASGTSAPLRSIDCFTVQPSANATVNGVGTVVVENVRPAERFRVRFCRRNDLTACSMHTDVNVDMAFIATLTPSWFLLAAVSAGVVTCALCCFAVLFCCRRLLLPGEFKGSSSTTTTVSTSSSHKVNPAGKKQFKLSGNVFINKYDVNSSISPNHKSNPMHGSQNDSGVFTLGSSTNALLQATNGLHLNSSHENWRQPTDSNHSSLDQSQYDFSNDPYLQDFHNLHGIVAMENGLAADELREPRTRSRQSGILNSVQSVAASMLLRQSQLQAQSRRSVSLSSSGGVALNVNPGATSLVGGGSAPHSHNSAENGEDRVDEMIVVSGGGGVSSNETLMVTTPSLDVPSTGAEHDSGASSAASLNGSNGCRVMREIIV